MLKDKKYTQQRARKKGVQFSELTWVILYFADHSKYIKLTFMITPSQFFSPLSVWHAVSFERSDELVSSEALECHLFSNFKTAAQSGTVFRGTRIRTFDFCKDCGCRGFGFGENFGYVYFFINYSMKYKALMKFFLILIYTNKNY